MKHFLTIIGYFIVSQIGSVFAGDSGLLSYDTLFSKYEVSISNSPIKTPSGFIKKENIWVDNLDKRINPPEINFAGEYYIALHSCGYECRYYTLHNLITGMDLTNKIDRFASTEPDPNLAPNQVYFIKLYFKPNSSLLIARYYKRLDIDKGDESNYKDCLYLFKNDDFVMNEKECPTYE